MTTDRAGPTPTAFAVLESSGRLAYGDDWADTWRDRALHDPPALLGTDAVEWWTADARAAWVAPAHWDPGLGLAPFAGDGTGDLWCWYPGWRDAGSGEAAVVLVAHDLNEATGFAPTFATFVARHLLAAVARTATWAVDRDGFTPDERRQALRANVDVVRDVLPVGAAALLDEALARPWVEVVEAHPTWEDRWWQLLDPDEERAAWAAITDAAGADPTHVDETFPYRR